MTLVAVVVEPPASFLSRVSVEVILLKKVAVIRNTIGYVYLYAQSARSETMLFARFFSRGSFTLGIIIYIQRKAFRTGLSATAVLRLR